MCVELCRYILDYITFTQLKNFTLWYKNNCDFLKYFHMASCNLIWFNNINKSQQNLSCVVQQRPTRTTTTNCLNNHFLTLWDNKPTLHRHRTLTCYYSPAITPRRLSVNSCPFTNSCKGNVGQKLGGSNRTSYETAEQGSLAEQWPSTERWS